MRLEFFYYLGRAHQDWPFFKAPVYNCFECIVKLILNINFIKPGYALGFDMKVQSEKPEVEVV